MDKQDNSARLPFMDRIESSVINIIATAKKYESEKKDELDKEERDRLSAELSAELENLTIEQLRQYIVYLCSARAFFHEDRLKLQILDNVDFTIWACDRDLNIKLWEGACEKVYSINKEDAIGENYLKLIVSPLERHQSKVDTLRIIDSGIPQQFRLCDDNDGRGFPIQVITQCCRIVDDDGKFLQAEMAINMNYNNLLHESEQFQKVQDDFNEEVNDRRKQCLELLEKCKDRILEVADNRINQYYHIGYDGRTYLTALNAIKKIVEYRKEFLLKYEEELTRIKKAGCFCDFTSEHFDKSEYTFDKGHAFDCIYRNNREEIIEWMARIQKMEIDYQMHMAEVQLEEPT